MTEKELEFAEGVASSGPVLQVYLDEAGLCIAERLVQRGVLVKERSPRGEYQYSTFLDLVYELAEEERIGRLAERATHGRA